MQSKRLNIRIQYVNPGAQLRALNFRGSHT